ncbi:MAG: hypothetical protein RR482_08955, partial [Clostridia bacterium]
MLALLFLVVPVLGVVSLFFQSVRWVFALAAVLALCAMWLLQCFTPRGRSFVSGILLALTLLAVFTAIQWKKPDNAFPSMQDTSAYAPAGKAINLGENDPSLIGINAPIQQTPGLAAPSPTDPPVSSQGMNAAALVVDQYFKLWQVGNDYQSMVQYTSPEWRNSQT